MSKSVFAADNNHSANYDIDDMDPKYNSTFNHIKDGLLTVDARTNLNINLGYQTKFFDLYITGFNLVQDKYIHLPVSYATTQGDPLHTRFMAGVRFNF